MHNQDSPRPKEKDKSGGHGWGLRRKSLLALAAACLIALIPAALVGWQAIQGVREDFGLAYARNLNELSRQRILAPVSRELALALRLAESEALRQWLEDENNPDKRAVFFREAEGFRHAFRDHSWFLGVTASGHYYFRDDASGTKFAPIGILSPAVETDGWFFGTLRTTDSFNINVDHDARLDLTKVWLNVVVWDDGRKIAVAGTGLDLSGFLHDFLVSEKVGTTPVIINCNGVIQAHPDRDLIPFNTATGSVKDQRTIFDLLGDATSRQALQDAMQSAELHPNTVETTWLDLDRKRQLVALSYIPELQWHVLTAVDLDAARLIDTGWIKPAIAAFALLLALLLFAFGSAVETLVLQPLRRLQQSAKAISEGHYAVALPTAGRDEIGDLSRTFETMADQVRRNTEELESKVQERTAALEASNRQMAAARRQLDASIDYASLIQRAILPDRQMAQSLGEHHFVLWRPRDVVGGDFYVFLADGENCLVGVVDCAGHGVPGALMTMLARAAIDHALNEVGSRSPAAVLARTDAAMRAMIEENQMFRAIATNIDAGLVYVDRPAGRLLFAGAKISLYWSDGDQVAEIKGDRRALVDRRNGDYHDRHFPLVPGRTYYLATDGILDQSGGDHGFGFGRRRFTAMLRDHAALPLAAQCTGFAETLARYQGERPQRDDITLLCFRFD